MGNNTKTYHVERVLLDTWYAWSESSEGFVYNERRFASSEAAEKHKVYLEMLDEQIG